MEENLEANDNEKSVKRFSLPLDSRNFNEGRLVSNRRHTFVPNRSILKPNIDGHHTINILPNIPKEKRRVSFAPEVTLHKINFLKPNEERKPKRKISLLGTSTQPNGSKLSTSQFIGKVYPAEILQTAHDSDPLSVDNQLTKGTICELNAPVKPQFVIDDDTQAMEMSIELTQQILKQQEQMKEQNYEITEHENISDARTSLRDLFDEVDDELNDNEEQVEMELTETIKFSAPNVQESEQAKDVSMELTQTAHIGPVFTSKPLSHKNVKHEKNENIVPENRSELDLPAGIHIVDADDEIQAMEFTQPIQKSVNNDASTAAPTEFSGTELTQPATNGNNKYMVSIQEIIDKSSEENAAPAEKPIDISDDESAMELTQPISKEQDDNEMSLISSDHKLSVVMEMSEPPTSAHSEAETYEKGDIDFDGKKGTMNENTQDMEETEIFKSSQISYTSKPNITNIQEQGALQNESEFTEESFITNERDTSEMETSLIGTEMIPLAEVTTDYTENHDDYDSDNSFTDDNHVNVSLEVFLNDVNVQFFDSIGPSESEIEQTLAFNPDFNSSFASSSPLTVSSGSTASTPTSNIHKRSNLIDYIDACTNIPYYHFIVHLINQYKSSIQSISTMVNTFSNDLLESNPTAIREYYQQNDEVKNDLCTNYQAIATFTRKQAKCQNTRFVASLLEQLSLSYERANELLEIDLAKAIEWRRGVLIERQHMIEKKVELDQYIQKLNSLKDNSSSTNVEKIKKSNEEMKNNRVKIEETKQNLTETSELIRTRKLLFLEKKTRKENLLKEIEELKLKVKKSKVPTTEDLKLLREELWKLEREKSIKLVSTDHITLLIMNSLQVEFQKTPERHYLPIFMLKDKNIFEPFSPLAHEFLLKYQGKSIDPSNIMTFIKSLIFEWKKFICLWKDLLKILYLHSGNVEKNKFKFEFSISDGTEFGESKFYVETKLNDLLDLEKSVNIKIVSGVENVDMEESKLLNHLKKLFSNKNSVINRLIVE